MRGDLAPTPRLRWVMRSLPAIPGESPDAGAGAMQVLQQWWAADVPSYMRGNEGEWRDVLVEDV